MSTSTDEITAFLTGAASSAGEHQRWLSANIDTAAQFMGVSINGGACRAIAPKLRAAEAALQPLTASSLGIRRLDGFQRGDFHAYHSWGLAIDVNYVTNPYIMHESGEGTLDAQLGPVFHRISRFLIISHPDHPTQDSIIPQLGSTTNAKDVYKALTVENDAMKHYFALMQDGPQLQNYLSSSDGVTGYGRAFASGRTSGAPPTPDAAFVQRQMQQDWTVLTSRNPLPSIVPATPSAAVPHPTTFQAAPRVDPSIDRPFDGPASQKSPLLAGRSPLSGYLDLSTDLVNTLA